MSTARCTWDAVAGVDGYNVYIKDNGAFVRRNLDPIIGTTYDVEGLDDGEHEGYAKSILNGVESDPSNVKAFEIIPLPPVEPDAPTNFDVTVVDGVAQCAWTAASEADGYNVYLKSNGEFVKQNSVLITDTTYDIEGLEDGNYEAYAKSVLNDVESDASNIKVFEVATADPYAPVHGNEFTWDGITYKVVVQDYGGGNTLAWLDRNLGASQVAESSTDADSYGDLYQWGRLTDGHQIRTSDNTSTQSTTDEPGHGDFILSTDWRDPQNNNLWQGADSINNPAPPGWRIPTETELNTERQSWSSNNAAGALASPLKLPVAGYRSSSSGSLLSVGSNGVYWLSSVDGSSARYLFFSSSSAGMYSFNRAFGSAVRCVRTIE